MKEQPQMLNAVPLTRFSPFVTDILFTSFIAAGVVICNIFLIRIISKGLGPEEFGAYTLARRTVATLLPFTSLSIGIGLARYIALYTGKARKTESILPAAVTVSSICTLLVCFAMFPFSRELSELVFNQEGRSILFKLILFLLFGETLSVCLYSYYRGQNKMFPANIWNALVLGILPLSVAILFIHMNNVNYIIFGIGGLFYLSLFSLLPKINYGIRTTNWEEFKSIAKILLTYSIPRAPGGVAITLIFNFGVLVAPYMGGIANAGYMSIGISIFQILLVATDSFGQVVLPKAAYYLGVGNEGYLIDKLRSIYDLVFEVGLFANIQIYLALDFLIIIWLGPAFSGAVPIARILILAIIPFLFYTLVRSIIDAVEIKPINAINASLSLFSTVICGLILIKIGLALPGLALSFDTGLISLGILTYSYMYRRYHISLLHNKYHLVLFINIIMGLFIYIEKYEYMSNQFSYKNGTIIFVSQLLCGIVYVAILRILGSTWIRDIEERIVISKTAT